MRIIFFGTPEIAVSCLDALKSKYEIVGVVTAVDKPGGRGHSLLESPVKKYASTHNLNLYQPVNLKSVKFLEQMRALEADYFIVVAFRMMPQVLWSIPKGGTINLHASLLPQFRGSAPIQRAIESGKKVTGLTTFFINENIDTGYILLQEVIEISDSDDFGSLYEKMEKSGGSLLIKTLDSLQNRSITPRMQESNLVSHAPKINAEDLLIHWDKSVIDIHNKIRAFSPVPGAYTIYHSQKFKILKSNPHLLLHTNIPGSWEVYQKKQLRIYGTDGFLEVLEIQAESKRKMNIQEFLNGYADKIK